MTGYAGKAQKNDMFRFAVSNRDADGKAIDTPADWTLTHYDVMDPQDGNIIIEDGTLSSTTEQQAFWFGEIDTTAAVFVVGQNYIIRVKNGTGEPTQFQDYVFHVESRIQTYLDTINDRLAYLRHDIENTVFPRLKRILGLSGENMFLDDFTYDDSSNITGHRLRIFVDTQNAQLATRDIPDSDLPELGEIHTYFITQALSLPRSLRVEHRSWIDADAADALVTDNLDTDQVESPGNAGWPDFT